MGAKVLWFSRDNQPKKKGIYRTSRTDIIELGSSYGVWDGKKWRQHNNWGDYSECYNLVWQGDGRGKRQPFKEIR